MKDFASSLLTLWRELGLNQRVSLVVAALAVIAGVIGLVVWSGRPDYQLLYARLSEKDAATIISTLEERNIPHRVSNGGETIYVAADQVYRMRMELAGKGVPTGDGVGFEIFDRGQFGLSDFVQRTNYNRALQGELARTISQLNGVARARVLIVQPENRLLLTGEGAKPTASVFIERSSSVIEREAINSIRHLVANAVQGLVPDEVAVVDQRGQVLSAGLEEDPMLGNASSLIRYRQQVEEYFSRKVEGMLTPVLGAGQAIVRVSAEIDAQAVTSTEERFDPESAVMRSQTRTTDDTNSSETRRGGVAGTTGNTPGTPEAAGTASPVVTNAQNRRNETVSYEINRVVSNTTRNPGNIVSLSAAVFVAARPPSADGVAAPPRTEQEIDALRRVVVNALGLKATPDQELSELVTIQEMPFQPDVVDTQIVELQKQTQIQSWVEVAVRYVAIGVAAIALLIFYRTLRKQRPEPLPVELMLASADTSSQRGAAGGPANLTPELLNELIRQKPANVGTALRDWATARRN